MRLARRGRGGPAGLGGLPLTSLIDVVFLLLIYFMFTATLSVAESRLASGLQAEKASGKGSTLQTQVVSVESDGAGRAVYRLGSRVLGSQAELEAILRRLPKEGGVFVRVSGSVTVDAAAAAVQACKDAGFRKVSYVPVP